MEGVIYILTGATAVGKTALALDWAEAYNAEILSCDSTLFYKGMDIGTAKPTPEERARVRHHGIDLVPVHKPFNIASYIEYAREVVADVFKRKKRLLVTGGSGFYLKSFLAPVVDGIEVAESILKKVELLYAEEGLQGLVNTLLTLNPQGVGSLDVKNPRRVMKALGRCLATGLGVVDLQKAFQAMEIPFRHYQKKTCLLLRQKTSLEERIRLRVRNMLERGWMSEVQHLKDAGIENNPTAASAIGYREILVALQQESPDWELLEQEIVQSTLGLVAKQRKWFRHQMEFDCVVDLDAELHFSWKDLWPSVNKESS